MQNTNIKVSIIVPVYNVEPYLEKCVKSLVDQTYKNIEILLVDDGSTDSSGKICDKYAELNNNIFVWHKNNAGQSSARNYAVSFASGKYITFVDSDDYVESDYVKYMIDSLDINNPADMVICTYVNERLNGKLTYCEEKNNMKMPVSPQRLNAEQALKMMCYEQQFGTSPCGKLILSSIVRQHPFPVGHIYEDLATVYKMIGVSKQIVFLNIPTYHYVHRTGSTTSSPWNNSVLYLMRAAQNLLNYIDCHYPLIHDAGVYRFFFSANEFYIRAFDEIDYIKIIEPVQKQLVEYCPCMLRNNDASLKQKIRFLMLAYTPCLYRSVWRLFKNLYN